MKHRLLLALLLIWFFKPAYSQPGALDHSFGAKGIVKTSIGTYYSSSANGHQLLLQADSSIYVSLINGSQSQSLITKRHANGSIDLSYGIGGYSDPVPFYDTHTFAFQSDGKILMAGPTNDGDFGVARYNTDGSLDSTFGTAGMQTTDFASGNDYASAVAVQSDGKIVVGGYAGAYGGTYFALARYNTDGSPDKTFSGDGKEISDFTVNSSPDNVEHGTSQVCYYIAVQADQKIVAAGYAGSDFAVSRYNADGSFAGDGKQTTDFGGSYDEANHVIIQQDGKIVLAGGASGSFALARYTVDGNLDNSFSNDGKQTLGYNIAYTDAVQPDGKIVAVGIGVVARFNTNGSIDKTFDHDGISDNFPGGAISVAVRSDGKILVVGDGGDGFILARLNTDGSRDDKFGDKGVVTDNVHLGNTTYASTAIQKDGKAVAAGYTYIGSKYSFALGRYNIDGSPDNTFSEDGKLITDFTDYNSYATSVAIQNDGKIVAAGYLGDGKFFAIVRYNADGSLDNSFNGNGKVTTGFGGGKNYAHSIAIQADGKIVAAGSAVAGSTVDFAVARYNTDGSLDASFGNDGKQTTDFENNFDAAYSIAIQPDGKIVAAGQAFTGSNDFALARYKSNGDLDNSFGNHGKKTTQLGHGNSVAYAVALQADGKIAVAGYAAENANYCFALVRYDADGNLDPAFAKDGKQLTHFGSYSAYAKSIAIQNDGKIIAGGYISTGDTYNSALARYNSDGKSDKSFSDSGKHIIEVAPGSNYINSIAIADNKLYAVGSGYYSGTFGVVTRYLLDRKNPPTVSITTPAYNTTYPAPGSVKLTTAALDSDGVVREVEFYSGSTLLHTETVAPYGYSWKNVPVGNYTVTAKATDDSGYFTISAPVNISVVPNTPPVVSIIKPANNQTYTDPAYIHFEAKASDAGGRIIRVEFYNGTTLLRTEYKSPYTHNWKNVPAGTYTITAVATDNFGTQTTSAPVTITVLKASIVSSRPYLETEKTALNDALSLRLSPNPANNIISISAGGLQQNKPTTISIISSAGMVLKTMHINNSLTQLNVSTLASGTYTLKIISGDRVMYKQFVKL